MKLSAYVQDLPGARLIHGGDGATDPEVRAVRDDSRAVETGDLFVAVKGTTVDGHEYAAQAVATSSAETSASRLRASMVQAPSNSMSVNA